MFTSLASPLVAEQKDITDKALAATVAATRGILKEIDTTTEFVGAQVSVLCFLTSVDHRRALMIFAFPMLGGPQNWHK
jgi:hypothetical protein